MLVAPDAEIDGKGVVIINSEEETEEIVGKKTLKEMGLADGSILSCDDFLQDFSVKIILYHSTELSEGVEFEIVGDCTKLEIKPEAPVETENGHKKEENGNGTAKNGNGTPDDDKDDIVTIDDDIVTIEEDKGDRKRKTDDNIEEKPAKKARPATEEQDEELVCID